MKKLFTTLVSFFVGMLVPAATVGDSVLTLTDWANVTDPEGKVAVIAEILNDTNEILDDMLFVEGNLPTGHEGTIRTGLPTVAWRLLNYGVAQSKSRTQKVTDTCGILSSVCEVDKKIADLNGNTAAFRMAEDKPFLEAMSQEFASKLFYGNASDPEQIVGLANRYNSLESNASGDDTAMAL